MTQLTIADLNPSDPYSKLFWIADVSIQLINKTNHNSRIANAPKSYPFFGFAEISPVILPPISHIATKITKTCKATNDKFSLMSMKNEEAISMNDNSISLGS